MPDTEHIIYCPRGERVTARIAPAAKAPWDVLTAQQARQIAGVLAEYGIAAFSWKLRHYADAVDAMTQPPRIEYETEAA